MPRSPGSSRTLLALSLLLSLLIGGCGEAGQALCSVKLKWHFSSAKFMALNRIDDLKLFRDSVHSIIDLVDSADTGGCNLATRQALSDVSGALKEAERLVSDDTAVAYALYAKSKGIDSTPFLLQLQAAKDRMKTAVRVLEREVL